MTSAQYDSFFDSNIQTRAPSFVGVLSTGIFCRKGCPARRPKPENCQFYSTADAALSDGFRACKRCHPMQRPDEARPIVKRLIARVEDDADFKGTEQDLIALGIDPSTARRQFQRRFNMTFTQYARARRLGQAAQALNKGDRVIDAQLTAGYSSASGFRQAFSERFGASPNRLDTEPLNIEWLDSELGTIIVICDSNALYLLEFTQRKNLDRQVERLKKTHKRAILPGRTKITDQIEGELSAYFAGRLKAFQTPLHMTGTEFQKTVWRALIDIPYGTTCAYLDLAKAVGNPKAFRAVATSNASNGLALIIPCHRVIATGGGLGGYAGGLPAKQWLIEMEAKNI